ncbi:MAG: tyrosine-type recombinase/integrase [Burkholderiales bacterium]
MMRRSLSAGEERTLLDTVSRHGAATARRDHAWMRALRFSGCRIGEFSLVSVGAALMALDTRHLFIPREHRKGGRIDHTVLVTAQLREALQDLLEARCEMTGEKAPDRHAPLVVNRYGTKLSVRSYEKRMAYWCRVAGLEVQATPHWFRHTRAMRIMQRSGAADPRGMVQVALGHADIKSSGVYTQPTREDFQAAMEAADGAPAMRKRDARRVYAARMAS